MDKEVLIIGAGPTGLAAAIMLSLHKVPVRILDKKTEPTKTSNALGIHVKTLEVFQMLSIVDEFLVLGETLQGFNIFAGNKPLIHLNFSGLQDTQYQHALALPQSDTEQILEVYLSKFGLQVERGLELESISQTDECANVTLMNMQSNQHEKKQYAWVLACDGAHSAVRKSLNIPFIGSSEDEHFIMMDCQLKNWDKPRDEGFIFFSEDGPVLAVAAGKDNRRVIVDVSQDESFKQVKKAEVQDFERILAERNIPFQFDSVKWISSFWTSYRRAETFQKEHVFFLGDSAHVHSPVGGQGMNTGIQDAYNLTWKLAMVYKEIAKPSILKTYNQERLPNAKRLLKATKDATKIVTAKKKWQQELRNFVLSCINKVDFIKNKIARQVAMLEIKYQSDLIIPSFHKAIKAGMRMPDFACEGEIHQHLYGMLNPCRYTLIFANMEIASLEQAWLQCLELDKDIHFNEKTGLTGMKEPFAILIRPDQYVGLIVKDKSALEGYLKKNFSTSLENSAILSH